MFPRTESTETILTASIVEDVELDPFFSLLASFPYVVCFGSAGAKLPRSISAI